MKDWTQEDERRFNEMTVRRGIVMSKRRQAVERVASNANLSSLTDDELVDALIAHADDLRDALQPFDSGVRLDKATEGAA